MPHSGGGDVTPFYQDDWLTLYGGDCRDVLRGLPSDSVDCVVTSPPYWGLRDYGAEGQLGLEPTPEEYVANMVEVFRDVRRVLKPSGTCWLNLGDSYAGGGGFSPDSPSNLAGAKQTTQKGSVKGRIAARDGLKPKDLVGIPWRVAFALQADGWYLRSEVIWQKPNPMPESVTDRPTKSHEQVFLLAKGQWKSRVVQLSDSNGKRRHLRDDFGPDGAYSWAGELSVRLATAILDRPEFKDQIGLGSLDPKVGEQGAEGSDSDAISGLPVEHRAAVWASRLLGADCSAEQFLSELHGLGITLSNRHNLRIGGSPTEVPLPPGVYAYGQTAIAIEHPGEVRQFDFLHNQIIQSAPSTCSYYFDAEAVRETQVSDHPSGNGFKRDARLSYRDGNGARGNDEQWQPSAAGRNIRSVWTIATRPYPGAHFAVFPPELPERCIKAGSSEKGVCPECGAPWERVVERTPPPDFGRGTQPKTGPMKSGDAARRNTNGGLHPVPPKILGWLPSCDCRNTGGQYADNGPHTAAPATVLDPFGGSGTVGMVANRLSRRAILIDLNPEYLEQQMKRNAQTPLGLGTA